MTRILTGFDFDPESLEVGSDGSFWLGDEFGPFLLNFDRTGKLLAPPYASAYKAPQNPTLDVLGGEKPVVGQSRGWEGLAISPDRRYLYPLFEGPLADDDIQTNRILEFDTKRKRFTGREMMLRLESPGGKVNLAALNIVVGGVTQPAYPGLRGTSGDRRLRPWRHDVDQRPPAAVPRAGRPRRRPRRAPLQEGVRLPRRRGRVIGRPGRTA